MAGDETTGGPKSGRGASRGSERGLEGLRRLGEQQDTSEGTRLVANEEGLRSLGDQPRVRSRRRLSPRVRRRRWIAAGVALALFIGALFGGSWFYLRWRFGQIPKVNVSAEQAVISGKPFNVLVIGSDSRSGLTGQIGAQAQDPNNPVTGQRSDVLMIWHMDPKNQAITVLSIPRDTIVSMTPALAADVGTFNRINSAFGKGPNELVSVVEHNFGIPINHVVQANFAGFVGAVNALGGVWMNFPNAARDAYSGLNITKTGCQLLDGTQALAVARSRHFEYLAYGKWYSDPSSDFGRIKRQGVFLRALINSAKSKYNPLTLNAFLGSIPQGIIIDSKFGLNELIGLAMAYHSMNPETIRTQTLPTLGVYGTKWGAVLFVDQPSAQQMLVDEFGSQLKAPTTPPPNKFLQTPQPPVVTTTSTTSPSVPTTKAAAGGMTKQGGSTRVTIPATTTTVNQAPGSPLNCMQ